MPKWGWVFLTLLIAGIGFTAPAQGASMVFIKTNKRVDGTGRRVKPGARHARWQAG
jgi:hypothetical protein